MTTEKFEEIVKISDRIIELEGLVKSLDVTKMKALSCNGLAVANDFDGAIIGYISSDEYIQIIDSRVESYLEELCMLKDQISDL